MGNSLFDDGLQCKDYSSLPAKCIFFKLALYFVDGSNIIK